MAKPYAELRGRLARNDIDQRYLCELLGRSQTYITSRITGKRPWDQDDMYKLMDIVGAPYEELHRYFPPKGRSELPQYAAVSRRGA